MLCLRSGPVCNEFHDGILTSGYGVRFELAFLGHEHFLRHSLLPIHRVYSLALECESDRSDVMLSLSCGAQTCELGMNAQYKYWYFCNMNHYSLRTWLL